MNYNGFEVKYHDGLFSMRCACGESFENYFARGSGIASGVGYMAEKISDHFDATEHVEDLGVDALKLLGSWLRNRG